MQEKQISNHHSHSFFMSNAKGNMRWQVIYSDLNFSLLFDTRKNTLIGLGSPLWNVQSKASPLIIDLHSDSPVKQIAASHFHVLVLYENGLLTGYGRNAVGELGVGIFSNFTLEPISITLPDKAIPTYIAAGNCYSLVVGDNHVLYGFGSNQSQQLGLGKDDRIVEFPKKVPLPENGIPQKVYTGHDKTIVVCEDNRYYGFGCIAANEFGPDIGFKLRQLPVRLKQFEALSPKAIAIGQDGIVVLSNEGKCFLYGIPALNYIPVKQNRIILPKEDMVIQQISFTNRALIIISNENEVWQASSPHPNWEFQKINLSQSASIRSIFAGYDAFFANSDTLYAWGNNASFKLPHEEKQFFDKPLPLTLNQAYRPLRYDTNSNRVTVVLDIDNVLATHDSCSSDTRLFFLRAGAIITAYNITHYIPPGRLEFLRFLFSIPQVRVIFFSSGAESRNRPFVQQLLTQALGKEFYSKIKQEIIIFSEQHCSRSSCSENEKQKSKYGIVSGPLKKDLEQTINLYDNENTIFIDNDPGVIQYEQEDNFLLAQTILASDFDQLGRVQAFSEDPITPLFCKLNDIFYLASTIYNCIQQKTNQPINEQLFSLHFKSVSANELNPNFVPKWETALPNLQHYKEGLELLKIHNSSLTFITPQSYNSVLKTNANHIEQDTIKNAKDHEHQDCLMM